MPELPNLPRQLRKRTKKACDRCNVSRVRCDGVHPCHRCDDLGYPCQYTRSTKRRGRKPTSRAVQSRSIHSAADEANTGESRIESSGIDDSVMSDSRSTEYLSILPDGPLQRIFSPGNSDNSPLSENITRPRATNEYSHVQKTILDSNEHGGTLHRVASESWSEPVVNPAAVLSNNTARLSQLQPAEVRYKCLKTIMPRLAEIIQPDIADQLLECYFQTPGTTPLSNASPYVLTQVIREKSLLHTSEPRPTSPALLATMLWVSAETADISVFFAPGQRRWICDRLRNLALVLISAKDQHQSHHYHHYSGIGAESSVSDLDPIVEIPKLSNEAAYQDHIHNVQHSFDESRRYSVDDVLVFILFSIVISAGDYKADCHVWWARAVRAARLIRLNEEQSGGHITEWGQPNDPERPIQYHSFQDAERREERRRAFWLLFCVDRHLAISFNTPLTVLDTECQVFRPLPDHVWANLERYSLEQLQALAHTVQPTSVTGTGFFEFFLPLMTILGNIIYLHRLREHPHFGMFDCQPLVTRIETELSDCAQSIENLACRDQTPHNDPLVSPIQQPEQVLPQGYDNHRHLSLSETTNRNPNRADLVSMYSTFILHVLYVLLHGKWDAISMLDNQDDWIASPGYLHCTSHAIYASEAISRILEYDPELMFMPYLLGIYLLHESFIILLFADRMAHLGPNESVKKACETIIRAHEVCMATLSTEFQRRFRKVLRSTMCNVTGAQWPDGDEMKSKRTALKMYRWTAGGRGLAL